LPPHPGPLPWGEGEPSPALVQVLRAQTVSSLVAILPLPKGEGRGEGGTVRRRVGAFECRIPRRVGTVLRRAGTARPTGATAYLAARSSSTTWGELTVTSRRSVTER